MTFIPKPHEIYKHFKGNLYQVVAVAEHSETGEQLVVYQAMYDDFKIYARPLSMFISKVDRQKYPKVPQEFRFELQGPDSVRQKEQMRGSEEEITESRKNKTAAGYQGWPEGIRSRQETSGESEPEASDIEEELDLDPMVLEFLDADSYEDRLNILAGLHHRITDDMLTTMAIACDVEVSEGELETRYDGLRSCLLTLQKYECNRLR